MQDTMLVFENKEFGKIRIINIDGMPWCVLADVCKILDLTNPTSVAQKLDEDEKLKVDPKSNLGSRSNVPVTVINESGLYAVILRSDKPNAKTFRKWVTSEVLPSVRKHGAYINEDVLHRMQEDSEYNAELLRILAAERNRSTALANKVAVLVPKAHYHDIVMQYPDAIPITLIAGDYGMTANAFNKLLHSLRIQRKVGGVWVLYKEHQGYGYTVTHTCTRNGIVVWMHTYWRQKGRRWLYDVLKSYGIVPVVEREAIQVQMSLFSVM